MLGTWTDGARCPIPPFEGFEIEVRSLFLPKRQPTSAEQGADLDGDVGEGRQRQELAGGNRGAHHEGAADTPPRSRAARRRIPRRDVGIGLLLAANTEYTREYPDFPPTSLSFDADGAAAIRMLGRPDAQEGSWTIEEGTIEVDLGDTSMRLRPRRAPYYLVLESGAATWAVDPVVCAG